MREQRVGKGGETATFDLTAVVSLQLGGGVHRHLAQGAVEEAHGLLLLGLPLWSRLPALWRPLLR